MRRTLRIFGLLAVLVGCGGGVAPQAPAGFANQTTHSDAELWTIWKQAQASIAQKVDMNALERSLKGAPPDIRPGDPRAWQVSPRQLTVTAEPDVSSAALFAATGVHRSDPTGMIACPAPCNVRFAVAYSRYTPVRLVAYANSWDADIQNFPAILEYEFENQIMYSLGYNMKWR
jgi:hypothetical protein